MKQRLNYMSGLLAAMILAASCGWGNPQGAESELPSGFEAETAQDDVAASEEYVSVEEREGLIIYTPDFSRIDFVTGTMPSKSEDDVIFVCAASFTGELLDEFKHSNVAGHHVSGGEFHKGFKCGPYNGVFTWSKQDGWKFYNFSHKNSEAPLRAVAEKGGMGYCQSLLYFNGERFKGCMKKKKVNEYRALCELDGRLCIIDCAHRMAFGSFMDALQTIGVSNALYCDMGLGWNYSWYRLPDGTVQEIHTIPGAYTTNWVTFYK